MPHKGRGRRNKRRIYMTHAHIPKHTYVSFVYVCVCIAYISLCIFMINCRCRRTCCWHFGAYKNTIVIAKKKIKNEKTGSWKEKEEITKLSTKVKVSVKCLYDILITQQTGIIIECRTALVGWKWLGYAILACILNRLEKFQERNSMAEKLFTVKPQK